jgi:pilus assembly protein CpaF
MTVLHANSTTAALERLETLMLMSGLDLTPAACRTQIASAVDIVIHFARFADGTRRLANISQVLGSSPQEGFHMEDLFTFEAEGFTPDGRLLGACKYTGAKPKFLEKFRLNNVPVPKWLTT